MSETRLERTERRARQVADLNSIMTRLDNLQGVCLLAKSSIAVDAFEFGETLRQLRELEKSLSEDIDRLQKDGEDGDW